MRRLCTLGLHCQSTADVQLRLLLRLSRTAAPGLKHCLIPGVPSSLPPHPSEQPRLAHQLKTTCLITSLFSFLFLRLVHSSAGACTRTVFILVVDSFRLPWPFFGAVCRPEQQKNLLANSHIVGLVRHPAFIILGSCAHRFWAPHFNSPPMTPSSLPARTAKALARLAVSRVGWCPDFSSLNLRRSGLIMFV